jgi:hypothetical protein
VRYFEWQGNSIFAFPVTFNPGWRKTMTTFQQTAVLLIVIWLVLVVVRFCRSNIVLIGGLSAIGLYVLVACASGQTTLAELGLGFPGSWLAAIGYALAGLGLLLACSPLADRLATRWFNQPPTLGAFRTKTTIFPSYSLRISLLYT